MDGVDGVSASVHPPRHFGHDALHYPQGITVQCWSHGSSVSLKGPVAKAWPPLLASTLR